MDTPEKYIVMVSGSRLKTRAAVIPSDLQALKQIEQYIYTTLIDLISSLHARFKHLIFIAGGASSGADKIIKDICEKYNYTYKGFKPDFSDGYAAWKFFERNIEMLKTCNLAVCFWDGQSAGTKHVIENALKLKKDLQVYFLPKS